MEPAAVCVRGDGEWLLVHRCTGCGTVHLNRIAGDDNPLPLMRLANAATRTAAVSAGMARTAVRASPYESMRRHDAKGRVR
jgi:hypothetical protein